MTFETYLDKSDDELFELLGTALLGEGPGLSPEDRAAHRRFGRTWFDNKQRELQRKICNHPGIQNLLGTTGSDRVIDAAAIYELLDKMGEDPVVAPLVAVLIARIGLGTFCANAPGA
ncbi:hypothetical protein [Actinomadura kijaniata]|uniref:hypothetical protein n=1 Tax=Actinomadura kijaniata TaxID=46161 RepID=UPI000837682F|nr:hypothetical protein [Actinomadura kijaniata]